MPIESRRWFQYLAGLAAVAVTLALATPIWFALRTHQSTAAVALPFLAAGAVSGFSRLLSLFLPLALLKAWPQLEQEAP
jgi:hypothetical protein